MIEPLRVGHRWPTVSSLTAVILMFIAAPQSGAWANHEIFLVGEMRDMASDPGWLVGILGNCIPSHDRSRLECTLSQTTIHKARSAADLAKSDAELRKAISTLEGRQELQKAICTPKKTDRASW